MPLRTIPQFMKDEGLTRHKVDQLLRSGLEHVLIGSTKMIPDGAFERFIDERTVRQCPEEIAVLGSDFSPSETPSTLSGQKAVAAASAARARRIGQRLKSRSRNSSMAGQGETGRVIPLKS